MTSPLERVHQLIAKALDLQRIATALNAAEPGKGEGELHEAMVNALIAVKQIAEHGLLPPVPKQGEQERGEQGGGEQGRRPEPNVRSEDDGSFWEELFGTEWRRVWRERQAQGTRANTSPRPPPRPTPQRSEPSNVPPTSYVSLPDGEYDLIGDRFTSHYICGKCSHSITGWHDKIIAVEARRTYHKDCLEKIRAARAASTRQPTGHTCAGCGDPIYAGDGWERHDHVHFHTGCVMGQFRKEGKHTRGSGR